MQQNVQNCTENMSPCTLTQGEGLGYNLLSIVFPGHCTPDKVRSLNSTHQSLRGSAAESRYGSWDEWRQVCSDS